jgi:hypothetical protein
MRWYAITFAICLPLITSCAGGGERTVPHGEASLAPASQFKIPATIANAVPPPPPNMTPRMPSSTQRSTRSGNAAFFAGEVALSNGVYYLALPNGTPFGYYSYLPQPNFIYHFDMGYEYVVDANDGVGGVYLYDFDSAHWWYTGRQFPFPYVYDFTENATLYYYPDANAAGRYTTNPRYFYNTATKNILAMYPSATSAAVTKTFSDSGKTISGQFDLPSLDAGAGTLTGWTEYGGASNSDAVEIRASNRNLCKMPESIHGKNLRPLYYITITPKTDITFLQASGGEPNPMMHLQSNLFDSAKRYSVYMFTGQYKQSNGENYNIQDLAVQNGALVVPSPFGGYFPHPVWQFQQMSHHYFAGCNTMEILEQ